MASSKHTTKKDRQAAQKLGLTSKDVANRAPTALERVSALSRPTTKSVQTEDVKQEIKTTDPRDHPRPRKILCTASLPYCSTQPHLGNIIGCVLSGDVFARFARLRGHDVRYICGTDEFGTAIETAAQLAGVTPAQLCDKYHVVHKEIYDWFGIQFDAFGRTSTPEPHRTITHMLFNALDANGYIIEKTVEQPYCTICNKFLADRFVVGTCPKPECGYTASRGDQCDKCSGMVDSPLHLLDPKCTACVANNNKISATTTKLESRRSTHLFLDLPKLAPALRAWFEVASVTGKWSTNAVTVTRAWLDGGLEARCITRDLKWGTPVPKKGYEDKVFYVWFDAPIGYMSITPDWQKWWLRSPSTSLTYITTTESRKDDESPVELYQYMGKDNIPFHAIMFPATLIGAGMVNLSPLKMSLGSESKDSQLTTVADACVVSVTSSTSARAPPKEVAHYTLVHHISATEHLQYSDGLKFSKTRKTGVFGEDARDSGIPADVWRYYLLATRPETADTVFEWKGFAARNNSDLQQNLGNFVQRALAFCRDRHDGLVPKTFGNGHDEGDFKSAISKHVDRYIQLLDGGHRLRDALFEVMEISRITNQWWHHAAPWRTTHTAASTLCIAVNCIYLMAHLIQPFMPTVATILCDQLNTAFDSNFLAAWRPHFISTVSTTTTTMKCEILVVESKDAIHNDSAVVPPSVIDTAAANPRYFQFHTWLPVGHRLGTPEPIFRELTDLQVATFEAQFSGEDCGNR